MADKSIEQMTLYELLAELDELESSIQGYAYFIERETDSQAIQDAIAAQAPLIQQYNRIYALLESTGDLPEAQDE